MTIPIEGIDHVVVMASDIDRSFQFYKDVLGGHSTFEKAFRSIISFSTISIISDRYPNNND